MQNKSIFRIASLVIIVMFIYMPANLSVGDTVIGFAYRFIWSLGPEVDNQFKVYTPNVPLLLAQLIAVGVITLFMTRANKN